MLAELADWDAMTTTNAWNVSGRDRTIYAPTCTVDAQLGAVRRRTFDAGWDECIVIDCDGIVVGRVRNRSWDADDTATAAGWRIELYELGPRLQRRAPVHGQLPRHQHLYR